MSKFIRVKLPGMCCIEVDIADINALEIQDCGDGEYVLCAYTSTQVLDVQFGKPDRLHFTLQRLHDLMGVEVIDL